MRRPVDEKLKTALERWLEVARTVPGFGRFTFDASETEAIATLIVDDLAVVDAINVGPYLAREPHVVQGETNVDSTTTG